MKISLKLAAILLFGIILGFTANNYAVSNIETNIAVVDVSKVVSDSKQIQSLQSEQKKKMEDLVKFVNNARTLITKETDVAKRKALEDKYNKELATKKSTIEKEYTTKLKQIETDINAVIAKDANDNGYSIVLAKGAVLYGGKDITANISKAIK